MKKESTALTLPAAPSFAAFADDPEYTRELVSEYFSDGIAADDLQTIKIPGAGGKSWDLPGDKSERTFTGIILAAHPFRLYWPEEFGVGGKQRPSCQSQDGIIGVGNPGGECRICPMAEWGTGKNGRGTACPPKHALYILLPDSTLPTRMDLPVMSLKSLRKYARDLLDHRVRESSAITQFGLSSAVSEDGITYSQATFTHVGTLDPEEAREAKAYALMLEEALGIQKKQRLPRQLSSNGEYKQLTQVSTVPPRSDLDEDELPDDFRQPGSMTEEEIPF